MPRTTRHKDCFLVWLVAEVASAQERPPKTDERALLTLTRQWILALQVFATEPVGARSGH